MAVRGEFALAVDTSSVSFRMVVLRAGSCREAGLG